MRKSATNSACLPRSISAIASIRLQSIIDHNITTTGHTLPTMRAALSTLTTLLTLTTAQISTEKALCPCGRTVNATGAETSWALFTELFESDFLHAAELKAQDKNTWIPQAYNVTPEASRGPYGKVSEVGNVVTNQNGRMYDWNGPGMRGEDPGLQLWVRKDAVRVDGGSGVPMAEIVSARDDILYGSFRIGMKTTQVSGTCGGFFFYRNDTNEIDMEFLSRNEQATSNHGFVNLVLQSPESADVGYIQSGSKDFDNHSIPFNPAEMYHEYRFDWLPDRVDFYFDSHWMSTIRTNVPKSPGAIHVSHWSNGNAGWSGGPPGEDAALTISYIKAYFNSSISETTTQSLDLCRAGEMPNSSCYIPDQQYPPDPTGPNGNSTGHTRFFMVDVEKSSPTSPVGPVNTPDVRSGAIRRGEMLRGWSMVMGVVFLAIVIEEVQCDVPLAVMSLLR